VEITGQLWHVLTQRPVKCVWLNFVYTILTFFFASPRDLEPRKLFRNRLNGYNFISFRFFLFIIVITLLFLLVYTLYNPIHYKRVLSRSCKSGSWQWKCPRHTIVCYYCMDVNLPPTKLNSQIYLRSIVGHDVIRL